MDVLIIGIVTISALVWIVVSSLANESESEKRRLAQRQPLEDHGERRADQSESLLAA